MQRNYKGGYFPHWPFWCRALAFYALPFTQAQESFRALSPSAQTVLIYSMNRIDFKLPYEAPIAEGFTLSAAPMNICVQFSGDADFDDFEEGEAL